MSSFYTITKKMMFPETGLFKLKKYDEDNIIFTAPSAKHTVIMSSPFSYINHGQKIHKFKYDSQPLALDVVQLGSSKFVVTGCKHGTIVVKAISQKIKEDSHEKIFQQVQTWKLKTSHTQQKFINEVTHFPENPHLLVNCYNNGSIAIWSLLSRKRLHLFQQVHQKYTYKLRFQTKNIIVSCGNDCNVIRTDLQKQKQLSRFVHPLPVWCAHPIDRNQIACVGLFGRANIWDVRSNRIAQVCNNKTSQSSFVINNPKNVLQIYYGDANTLRKWDRRKPQNETLSMHTMNVSVECMLFDKDRLYTCGRGKDLCEFKASSSLVPASSQPPFFHTVYLNQNSSNSQMQYQDQDDESNSSNQLSEQDSIEAESQMQQESSRLVKKSESMNEKQITPEFIAKLSIPQLLKYREAESKWIKNDDQQEAEDDIQMIKREWKIVDKQNVQEIPKQPKKEQHQQQQRAKKQ